MLFPSRRYIFTSAEKHFRLRGGKRFPPQRYELFLCKTKVMEKVESTKTIPTKAEKNNVETFYRKYKKQKTRQIAGL